jgi:uncharacterized protein (TIGR02001 family)
MMKKTLIATAMLATTSVAQAEISANVAMASDYVFRGISQTDNQMALQGGFDYEHDSGLYLGTWASNVSQDFFNPDGSNDPQLEVDLYAGYSGEIGVIGYDVGYLRYQYRGFSDAGTNEWYASGSYSADNIGDFSLSLNYSPELKFLPSDQSAWYLNAGYETTLPWYEIGVSANFGYSFGDAFDVSDSDRADGDSGFNDTYTDWSIGVSKSVYGVDLGLTYIDQDFSSSKDKCGTDVCQSKFVASISKSF